MMTYPATTIPVITRSSTPIMINARRRRRRSSGERSAATLRLSDLTVRRDGDWRASSTTIQPRNVHIVHRPQSRTGLRALEYYLPVPSHGRAGVVRTERDQSKMPGALDGRGHRALVLGADPGLAARLYLPPVGHVPAKAVSILVINVFDMVNTEAANLPATVITRSSSAESASRPAPRTVSSASRSAATSATRTVSSTATRTVSTPAGPAATSATRTVPSTAARTIATLLSAGSATATWTIAAALRPARSRTLVRWSSCLLRCHINSPSATWHCLKSVFAGPEASGYRICRLPG